MKNELLNLATLSVNQLPEIVGIEEKQLALAENYPFVEITDGKTEAEAKKNRTALRTGRTTIEGGDKVIGSNLSKFRKACKVENERLVAITKGKEDKQQAEIDRWEAEKLKLKNEKEENERKRVSKIKDAIDKEEVDLTFIIENMEFPNISKDGKTFDEHWANTKKNFDFQEFDTLLDLMIERKVIDFDKQAQDLKEAENERIENLKKSQIAKIDALFVNATKILDETTNKNKGDLIESLSVLFSLDFAFGEKKEFFDAMVKEFSTKADDKIKILDEQAKKAKKQAETEAELARVQKVDKLQKERLGELLPYISQGPDIDITVLGELSEKDYKIIYTLRKEKFDSGQEKLNKEILTKRINQALSIGLKEIDGFLTGFGFNIETETLTISSDEDYKEWLIESEQKIKDFVPEKIEPKKETHSVSYPTSSRPISTEKTLVLESDKDDSTKQNILNTISDLCSNFLYYDRKEDEDLSAEQLKDAVTNEKITIDEMVSEFRKNLENTLL